MAETTSAPTSYGTIGVIGAGAWGTALAIQAARAGRSVALWARDPARLEAGENPRLPGLRLPEAVRVTGELPSAELVLLVVPLQHMRAVAAHTRRERGRRGRDRGGRSIGPRYRCDHVRFSAADDSHRAM